MSTIHIDLLRKTPPNDRHMLSYHSQLGQGKHVFVLTEFVCVCVCVRTRVYVCLYIYIYIYVCVCVCMCVDNLVCSWKFGEPGL